MKLESWLRRHPLIGYFALAYVAPEAWVADEQPNQAPSRGRRNWYYVAGIVTRLGRSKTPPKNEGKIGRAGWAAS